MTNKLSKHAGGGNTLYVPHKMLFDGSTGYYSLAGDQDLTAGFTVVGSFVWEGGTITSAGGFNRVLLQIRGPSHIKCQIAIINDELGDSRAGCLSVYSQDNTGTIICNASSNIVVSDGNTYNFFIAYNPITGTVIIAINGLSDLQEGATVTTGTMESGSGSNYIGTRLELDRFFDGKLGYLGISGVAGTNITDFYHPSNGLQEIDESTWEEWGSQPLFWNQYGDMEDNKGTAGNMIKNGAIEPSYNPVVTFPILGLNTIGDAVADDITQGKVAWVDGVEVVGTLVPPEGFHKSGGHNGVVLYYEFPIGQSGTFTPNPNDDAIIRDTDYSFIASANGTIDTKGWYEPAGNYHIAAGTAIGAGALPPIPAGKKREYSVLCHLPQAAADSGAYMFLYINYLDTSNRVWLGIQSDGTYWRVSIDEQVAGTVTNRLYTAITGASPRDENIVRASIIDNGDTVHAGAYCVDFTSALGVSGGGGQYTVSGRANKSVQSFRACRGYTAGIRFKSVTVRDF